MSQGRSTVPGWVLPVLIVALAAVLRLVHLGAENLWIDEVFSLDQAAPAIEEIADYWDLDDQETTRPLGLVLLTWIRGLGSSEFLLRLPFAILSILDVGALYLLAHQLVDRRTSLTAALILAVMPIHVWYAQEVRWYAQWAFLTTLSFYAIVKAWKSGGIGWWVAFVMLGVLNLYTFIVTLHVLVMQAVTAWFLPDRGHRGAFRLKALAAFATVGAVGLPAGLSALGFTRGGGTGDIVGTPRPPSPMFLPYTYFAFIAGFTVGPSVAELHDLPSGGTVLREHPEVLLYLVVFGPLALAGIWALRRHADRAAVVLPWVFGIPLLVLASALLTGQTYNARYGYAAVPGLALLLAVGVESLGRWRLPALASAVALFGYSLANYYIDPHYDKEHVRDAVEFIRGEADPQEPVAVIGQGFPAVEHYGAGLSVVELVGCRDDDETVPLTADPYQPEDLLDDPEVWLVVSRDWPSLAGSCRAHLGATHDVEVHREFVGVEVWKLVRP